MAKALQRRRGTNEEHKSFTGLEGEFTYDTTEKRIVAHDGVTKGGIPMATKKEVEEVANSLDPRILDAASQADILEAVSQATVGGTQQPPEGLMLSHVVGEEWHSFTGQIPVGGVPYCGQLVTREVYRDLWEYAQTQGLVKSESEWQSVASAQNGNVAFYSDGDGSTTFRMPSIKGYVKGASSQSQAGKYITEGLPNITGQTLTNYNDASKFNGAFVYTGSSFSGVGANSQTNTYINLDASRSNPIYGNSEHVTPETNTVLFGVFAFGNIVNVGELDAGTIASGLARVESVLGDIDSTINDKLGNLITVVESWVSGTQWYNKYSNGFIEQGGYFAGASNGDHIVTLNTEFKTVDYTVLVLNKGQISHDAFNGFGENGKTTTTVTVYSWTGATTGFYWEAKGY